MKTVNEYDPDVITFKIINPCFFDLSTKLPYVLTYYSNLLYEIPSGIYELIKSNPYIQSADYNLICKDKYINIELQQTPCNKLINYIFFSINDYDAQVAIIVMHDNKINLRNKCLLKKNVSFIIKNVYKKIFTNIKNMIYFIIWENRNEW